MSLKKISALALVVAAASLSLTACSTNAGAANSAANASSASPSASTGSARTTRHASSAGSTCKTNSLGFSASATGVKHELVVNLKNNGASTCSLHGFPGVHLVNANGSRAAGPDAALTDISPDSPPTVTIAPGEETRFLLDYIPDTSGSGKTFTKLSVAAPKDSVSKIVGLEGLDITIASPGSDVPDVYVDPIGYHVGYGK
ncbi:MULTISPECIES: DUF4232 domain-containing protein [unclassified Streptomyces]|uniref:DUF4232 domain-containing protein n=1 Tax=unclassified Streptomyces TaxID=2593676 RepID=UPI0029B4D593|nr:MULTISPECIES: DUF4232 domain-containing protein [unclassified Streptomyces]MDX3772355.1 DUF4232 domain-containing protein [Streptomyces sp. AK08-01B]MDX3821853.1 DUF4232 domain-containing protein [Streptomyces sp. AK08-01A]